MTSRNVTEIEDGDVFFVVVCSIFFSADSLVLIYIDCWELMKSVGRHGSSSTMMKVMVWNFLSTTLILLWLCTRSYCVSFGFAGTFKVLLWTFATIMSLICFCRSVGLVVPNPKDPLVKGCIWISFPASSWRCLFLCQEFSEFFLQQQLEP
jgi:hypothetical protein